MGEVLKYPLTPIPLSLCHVDGTLQKTQKSKLLTDLEGIIVHTEPRSINVTIVDAMFFLHLINDPPTTFGDISKFILRRLCKLESDQIHLVFDKVVKPSIKDCERDARAGASDRSETFEISGPSQKRPKNFTAALRNDSFKESLIRFLASSWEDPSTAEILKNKTLFVTCDNRCFCYNVEDGQLQRNEQTHLYSIHEEADSGMIFHLKSLSGRNNIVVRTNDTDVLVIILSNMDKLIASSHIWLEVGVNTLNTLRYIDVTSLYTHLGSPLCAALAGFHAFTGCDYTASFSRRGKSRPLKLLQKDPDVMTLFGSLGNRETVTAEQLKIAENFVCQMYGKTKCESVDDARLDIFFKKYQPKKNDSPISCVRKMDDSSLPTCSRVVLEKLKRTNYVCSIWLNAFEAYPPDFNPENCGWVMKEGAYRILWFEGDVSPTSVDGICHDDEDDETAGNDDYEDGEDDTDYDDDQDDGD